MNDLTLQVEGMSCAVCVGKVQRTLEGLPFVGNPNVDLATENASASLDDAADVAGVAAALAQSGYPVVADRLELSVEGLADAAAVARAEALLAALAGSSTRRSTLRPKRRRSPSPPVSCRCRG